MGVPSLMAPVKPHRTSEKLNRPQAVARCPLAPAWEMKFCSDPRSNLDLQTPVVQLHYLHETSTCRANRCGFKGSDSDPICKKSPSFYPWYFRIIPEKKNTPLAPRGPGVEQQPLDGPLSSTLAVWIPVVPPGCDLNFQGEKWWHLGNLTLNLQVKKPTYSTFNAW